MAIAKRAQPRIQDDGVLSILASRLESLDRNLEELKIEVRSKLGEMERGVDKIDHRLWGNGQPGVISDIERDLKETNEQHEKLEKLVWRLGGAVIIAVVVVGLSTGNGFGNMGNLLKLFGL